MTNLLNYENHGVAETSDVTAAQVGHLYSLQAQDAVDNGSFVALGDFVSGDVWKAKKPAKTDKVILIDTSVVIYEDYTKKCQEEARFYNAKNDIMRGYELRVTDKIALSAECFAEEAEPAVGKYIAMAGSSYKAMTYGSEPTDTAFVGYIYDVAANGNFRVIVQKNTDNFVAPKG